MTRRIADWIIAILIGGTLFLAAQELYPAQSTTSNGWLAAFEAGR